MRVPYIGPSSLDFDRAFEVRIYSRGGSIHDIRTYQRGGSLLGALSGVVGRALPFLRSLILPEIGNFAKNVASDIGNNIPIKQTLRRNAISSGKTIARKIIGGAKRLKSRKNKTQTKVKSIRKK